MTSSRPTKSSLSTSYEKSNKMSFGTCCPRTRPCHHPLPTAARRETVGHLLRLHLLAVALPGPSRGTGLLPLQHRGAPVRRTRPTSQAPLQHLRRRRSLLDPSSMPPRRWPMPASWLIWQRRDRDLRLQRRPLARLRRRDLQRRRSKTRTRPISSASLPLSSAPYLRLRQPVAQCRRLLPPEATLLR